MLNAQGCIKRKTTNSTETAAVRSNVSDRTNTRISLSCYQLCEGQEYMTAEI